jgi:Mitochondrial carrier protein
MWMRTAMNYQYKTGESMTVAFKNLYADGGIRRFYRGYGAALAQGPLSRFGDTAANVGVLTLLNSSENTRDLPIGVKTFLSSGVAATWRIFLMPIDTVKTSLQVHGKEGLAKLKVKQQTAGIGTYYHGALGASAATFAGHYPWFATYNFLDATIPNPDDLMWKLSRNAGIGFGASVVSDTTSNSLRVLKTVRQTSSKSISYVEAAQDVIAKDGVMGLMGRGLRTRLIANGMQGMMFSVAWKYFDDKLKGVMAKKD